MTPEQIKNRMAQRVGLALHEIQDSIDEINAAGFRCEQFILVHKNPLERFQWMADSLAQVHFDSWDERLRLKFGRIVTSLSYLLNSTSCRDGILHDFDADELDRKLGRVKRVYDCSNCGDVQNVTIAEDGEGSETFCDRCEAIVREKHVE